MVQEKEEAEGSLHSEFAELRGGAAHLAEAEAFKLLNILEEVP